MVFWVAKRLKDRHTLCSPGARDDEWDERQTEPRIPGRNNSRKKILGGNNDLEESFHILERQSAVSTTRTRFMPRKHLKVLEASTFDRSMGFTYAGDED